MMSVLKRVAVALLAAVGVISILGSAARSAAFYFTRGSPTGIVADSAWAPLPGVPVFLDRGTGAIERYVTDSAGRFFLPLERTDLQRARWLICPPGAIPMVGSYVPNHLGPVTYSPGPLHGGPAVNLYRSKGWSGPIPRECPESRETMGWRYSLTPGEPPDQ